MSEHILVCYTDGSAQPNPGYGGSGLFGYTLKTSKRPKSVNYPMNDKLRFTRFGIKSKVDVEKEGIENNYEVVNIVESINCIESDTATNNMGEIDGLINAFKLGLHIEGITHIHVISDSKYTLDGYTKNLNKWSKNFYRTSTGQEVKNIDRWVKLAEMRDELNSRNIKVTTEWVKGHDDDPGNTIADLYALVATNYSKVQFDRKLDGTDEFVEYPLLGITPIKTFKEQLADNHYIIDYKNSMFHTSDSSRDTVLLSCTYKGSIEEVSGKRTYNATYAVIKNDVPKAIKDIRDEFDKVPRNFNTTSVIDIEMLKKNKLISRLVDILGVEPLVASIKVDGNKNALAIFNRSGIVVRETGFEFTHVKETYETFSILSDTIMRFNNLKEKGKLIDVTDVCYDLENHTSKILYSDRELDFTDKVIEHGLRPVNRICLTIGRDTPTYVVFNSVADCVKGVYIYPDIVYNRNLITLITIIEYEKDGKMCYIAQTHGLGKFLNKC